MKCSRCHSENREGLRFCAQCGAPLSLTCPSCGFAIEPGERFCGGCGHDLSKPATPHSPPEPEPSRPSASAQTPAPSGERRQATV
ncbi:MAG: zinc ribbon domain-containing protein, partial [SAR324 cluster bacterium]|nr:zinc ribbon domain-containing protein [SAR324 cluster bacterium]